MFATEKGKELIVPKLSKEQQEVLEKHILEYIEAHLENIEALKNRKKEKKKCLIERKKK